MEFRGLYDFRDKKNEQRYFEFGAHFRYNDLVKELKTLQESQSIKKEKYSNINNSNLNSNNSNYNELYNQINKQLFQKMTDIISPNKLIQSRNIKPLIQSLSQKLTDIVQSHNKKNSLKHNMTKNKYINSNGSTKHRKKNNIINISNNKNSGNKNINISNNIKIKNPIKGQDKNYVDIYPSTSKQQEISQSRNYIKNKKASIKKNIKNNQQSINKKNNINSQEIKQYKSLHNKNQKSGKSIINNFSNNNEIIYGTIIENNNINNSNTKQNTQTVQNIIVKPNINISFINNYNTTFLPKNKKRSPKKVRSRNNQEISKLNMVEHQIFNINKNFKMPEDLGEDYINDNNRIYQQNKESSISKNKNKIDIIFLQKNEKINLKQMHKKSPFISPKIKKRKNNEDNSNNRQNIGSCKNRNIKMNRNFNNNFTNKDQKQQNNMIQEKLIRNINKKLTQNMHGKNKINKTSNEINQINILNNGNLINNYIINNSIQNKNIKSNNNILNNNIQQNRLSYINLNDCKKKNLVIRNNIVLTNNIITDKKGVLEGYMDEENPIINF